MRLKRSSAPAVKQKHPKRRLAPVRLGCYWRTYATGTFRAIFGSTFSSEA
jgi:hypothetical protein